MRAITWILIFLIFLLDPYFVNSQQNVKVDLFSVSFPDEKHGWACGHWGIVFHTSDGGHTWVRQESGTDYTLCSIYFVDTLTGWAVGDGGTIIHTKDGGKTWVKQESPVPYILMGAYFVNRQKGWIVGERTHILHTEDGGKKWVIQFKDEDFFLKSVSFCDEQTGWAVGEYGYIYHTVNGGESWEHQAGKFGFSETTGDIVGGNFLFDVVAINPLTAWVVGIDGYVARTEDRGTSWQRMTEGIPKTHLFGVAVDGKKILIGGRGLLLMSSDGGESFQHMKADPPVTYGWIYRIEHIGGKRFVAVGSKGWIYLGSSEEASWDRIRRE